MIITGSSHYVKVRILEFLSKQFTICKLQKLGRWIVSKIELFCDVNLV